MEENPILIIDDDEDDLELIQTVAQELNIDRPIKYFKNGDELINYLKADSPTPFLIVCEVNLPRQNGFDIRKQVAEDEKMKYKSVPFVFWSTSASEKQIQYAYDLPAQGFFFKSNDFKSLCDTFKIMLDYWEKSQHPKRLS